MPSVVKRKHYKVPICAEVISNYWRQGAWSGVATGGCAAPGQQPFCSALGLFL